ncbi:hypothetical protein [Streptomyces dioscori]|uniref:hypothetical protein n=1 Tax=Streptomyces dioscori TaxID=2109333 RepID=UPI00131E54A6|nr:hypothetical protein [Streptomyces dioscori]
METFAWHVAAARPAVDSLPDHKASERLRVAAIAASTVAPLHFNLSHEAALTRTAS